MQMVGKHADGDCLEWMAILDNLVDPPQVLDVTHEEITRPVRERDGEEIGTPLIVARTYCGMISSRSDD
jgi:hypothetical protein